MLTDQIADHLACGCAHASLGAVRMPDGYALMLDADEQYYYWLRADGQQSVICWNRWAVYRGAVADAARQPRVIEA